MSSIAIELNIPTTIPAIDKPFWVLFSSAVDNPTIPRIAPIRPSHQNTNNDTQDNTNDTIAQAI